MLCSRCSEPVDPIIAVDIDGTLGDYYKHILQFALGYLGKMGYGFPAYDGSMSHGEWYETYLDISREEFRQIKLAFRQGSLKRTMPVYHDRVQMLHSLKDAYGCEIWLTTTRPYLRLDNVDPDTRWWLEHNDVPFDYLLYDDDKYQELALRVDESRVVAVVDNEPEMLDEAERVFNPGVPILAKDWHNEGCGWIGPYGYTGRELFSEIAKRVKTWHDRYIHSSQT